jgi:hypothetical protein
LGLPILFLLDVGFEVLTAVTIKSVVFLDVMTCNPVVHRRLGGMYSLHLQGLRVREAASKK